VPNRLNLLLLISIVHCCLCIRVCVGQIDENTTADFDFEQEWSNATFSSKWFKWGTDDYSFSLDSNIKFSGRYSIRINSVKKTSDQSFGCYAISIPVDFSGNEIELRAYMKFMNVLKPIGLMLRIDGNADVLAFDNMQERKILGTSEWNEYSVKIKLPKNAKTIYIGAILSGDGVLWADKFSIWIDDKPLSMAPKVILAKSILDSDTIYNTQSKITISKVDRNITKNLFLLCKIWGFLKYYSPAVAAGKYNWDSELFRILPRIAMAKGSRERNHELTSWIKSLDKEVVNSAPYTNNNLEFKSQPNLKWIYNSSEFGDSLTDDLVMILRANRTDTNFYVSLDPDIGQPEFKNEKSYSEIPFSDQGFALLTLFRYWNAIEYFYPYRYLLNKWDENLIRYIPVFLRIRTKLEFQQAISELIAQIQDSHALLYGNNFELEKSKGLNSIPYEIQFINNKPIISGEFAIIPGISDPLNDSIKCNVLKRGDAILRINNVTVKNIIKARQPVIAASNFASLQRELAADLFRTNDDSLTLEYKRLGKTESVRLKCYPTSSIRKIKLDTCFTFLKPDLAYIYPATIKKEYIPIIMKDLLKSKGLIIDLRYYPSDFILYDLCSYLMPDTISFAKFTVGNINMPGVFSFTENMKVGKPNHDYFRGKVILLINEWTQSQGEYTAMALRCAPNAITVGNTTAGADGNISFIRLPGGVSTTITGIGVYYPNGRETQRVGIIPDVLMKPTITGIRQGKDELLENAINIINDSE
jgi:hypothetical protein